jgi:hypothetical protein
MSVAILSGVTGATTHAKPVDAIPTAIEPAMNTCAGRGIEAKGVKTEEF